jgi:enediyne biosynthesis thioesterase
MRAYEYRHIVGLEETNVQGNVYFANHVRWQGRTRELFLREHAPQIFNELQQGLGLVTTRVSCEYYAELSAFDELVLRMYVGALTQSRITMRFEYLRVGATGMELVARGEQQVACVRREGKQTGPCAVPAILRDALLRFM